MPKKIVLLFDGTRNGPEKPRGKPTNVEILASYLKAKPLRNTRNPRGLKGRSVKISIHRDQLIAGYISGVGADTKYVLDLFPAGTGAGLAHSIRLGYKFLSKEYEPGDDIYLFGFSRGAFAARSLAGFVDCVGLAFSQLPEWQFDQVVDQAYFAYEFSPGSTAAVREGIRKYLVGSQHDVRFNAKMADSRFEALPIYFIGIWDAVEALGAPFQEVAIVRSFKSYHQTELPPNVKYAYHGLSLHELRTDFKPHLWTKKQARQVVAQRWFAGDHSDIGGGHENRGLADIPFRWMLRQAKNAGFPRLDDLLDAFPLVPPDTPINQVWGAFPYFILRPAIREALRTYEKLHEPVPLGGEVDPTVRSRLLGDVDDYMRYRLGIEKIFGALNDEDCQIKCLREVDKLTLKVLLRHDSDFDKLSEKEKKALLKGASTSTADLVFKQLKGKIAEQGK